MILLKTVSKIFLGSLGATVPGFIILYLVIMLFWLVGIHGNNMGSAVK